MNKQKAELEEWTEELSRLGYRFHADDRVEETRGVTQRAESRVSGCMNTLSREEAITFTVLYEATLEELSRVRKSEAEVLVCSSLVDQSNRGLFVAFDTL